MRAYQKSLTGLEAPNYQNGINAGFTTRVTLIIGWFRRGAFGMAVCDGLHLLAGFHVPIKSLCRTPSTNVHCNLANQSVRGRKYWIKMLQPVAL